MKIFVINLIRSPERRASMERQLSHLNLDYEIFEAVDGSKLSYSDIMRETKPLNYALTCGEIGCSLSHINIYRRIIAKNITQALILEDDALINEESANALSFLEKMNTSAPKVTLLTDVSQYISKPLNNCGNAPFSIYKVIEASRSHGYVINLAAAKKLIEFLYPVWMVADRWQTLNEYSVCNIEAIIPPVIFKTEHSENSTIQIQNEKDKWIYLKKKYMWEAIKKNRPLKVKLRRFFWTSFIYPLLKISK